MKKLILCLALALVFSLCASTSWAITTLHSAQYLWKWDGKDAYGTLVDPIFPDPYASSWTIGDTSGGTVAQVNEVVNLINEETGLTEFIWTVWNDDVTGEVFPITLDSFHIRSNGFEPVSWAAPTGWSFTHTGEYYIWQTTAGNGILGGASLNNMRVQVYTPYWEVSNGAIDYFPQLNSDVPTIWDGNGYWRASHPAVPEPSSILLLGMGLFGFAGRVARKRFKA